MDKAIFFGGILILTGGISIFAFDNDGIGLISGLLLGLGLGFVLTGRLSSNSKV